MRVVRANQTAAVGNRWWKMTEGEILEALGIDRPELRYRARVAGWTGSTFRREMVTEGWQQRFATAFESGLAAQERARDLEQIGAMCRRALAGGLAALGGFDVEQMVAWIKPPALKSLAVRYDIARDGGRLVLGPTGVGKSVAGACVTRRRIETEYMASKAAAGFSRHRGDSIVWVRALDLPNARLQLALGKGEAELVVRATQTPYLVLDDIGWESHRAGADDVLAEVIARRYDQGLTTFATSGLTLEQFRERYSDAIVRRIIEAGGKPGKVVDLWQRAALKAV